MAKATLPRDKRAKLLARLRSGHDLESAMIDVGVSRKQITAGGDALAEDIAEAFRAGSARIRGRLLEGALEGDNAAVLLRLLERREEVQRLMGGDDGITEIRRVIVPKVCERCGQDAIIGAEVVPIAPSGPRLVPADSEEAADA